MAKKIVVVKDAETPEPDAIIAASIIDLSNGIQRLLDGPLTRRAILLLLRDITDLGMNEIDRVLNAIPQLKDFVKSKSKKKGG